MNGISSHYRRFVFIVFICLSSSIMIYDWYIRRESEKFIKDIKLNSPVLTVNNFFQYLHNKFFNSTETHMEEFPLHEIRNPSHNLAPSKVSPESKPLIQHNKGYETQNLREKNSLFQHHKEKEQFTDASKNSILKETILTKDQNPSVVRKMYKRRKTKNIHLSQIVSLHHIKEARFPDSFEQAQLEGTSTEKQPFDTQVNISYINKRKKTAYPNLVPPLRAFLNELRNGQTSYVEYNRTVSKINSGLDGNGSILDTPGCKVQKFDPWDPSVADLIETKLGKFCSGPPLFMRSQPDGSILLNVTVLDVHYNMKPSDLRCYYQSIQRRREQPGKLREDNFHINPLGINLKFGIPLNEDYVRVHCQMKKQNFEQFLPLIRLKKEIEVERNSIQVPFPRLNVILLGIDSVSKLNFLRHFPRTHAFLKEKLYPYVMNGYTKVGDNTFPNLVPLLTGHFVEHYWNEKMSNITYFDDLDFVWKDYAKRGYRTFYAEDDPLAGTFNYEKRGFYDSPTDYYIRPMALAFESTLELNVRNDGEAICLHSLSETDVIYDYLRDFIQAMRERPFFAFAMVSSITHDELNHASYADAPTLDILEDLWSTGALNNSLLVLFSDHGLRFGPIRETYIGKVEERMPFMFINVPNWFKNMYPDFTSSLRTNQNRLMTLFDVHATMLDLLFLNEETNFKTKHPSILGSSLLRTLSPNRTCTEANILPHWCPCQTFQTVRLSDRSTIKVSHAIVQSINQQLAVHQAFCVILEVDRIIDARIGQTNSVFSTIGDNSKKVNPIVDYLITLVTKPGGAVFEGTVRVDTETNSFTVLGISRINRYGMQSWCIHSQKMKIFCYCKEQKV